MVLKMEGGEWSLPEKLCHLQFVVEVGEQDFELEEIPDCPDTKDSNQLKCIIGCANENYAIPSNIVPNNFKYLRIISSDDQENLTNSLGKVLTYSLQGSAESTTLPEIQIKTNNNGRLCIKIQTCPPTLCKITYKNNVLGEFKLMATCASHSSSCTQFNNFLPHYEVHCTNLPKIVYNKVSKYTGSFEGSKMHFYPQRTDNENTVQLKFQNSIKGEICLFKYKQGVKVGDVDDNTCIYQSKCGNADGCCYSLCDDVLVHFDEPPPSYVRTVIYTRFTIGGANPSDICTKCIPQDALTTNKADLVMTENLLTDITSSGFKFHAEQFKQNSDSFVSKCNTKYMKADQPAPDQLDDLDCSPSGKCSTDCEALDVIGLMPGTSYLVRMYDHGVTNVPGARFEYFVVTASSPDNSNYNIDPSVTPKPTFTGFIVGFRKSRMLQKNLLKFPSCRYFVSLAGKNAYTSAMCEKQQPCMGFCDETLNINGLKHSTAYDIKVDTNKYLGTFYYTNVETLPLEKNLNFNFDGTKLVVEATFTSKGNPIEAKCEWIIYSVKEGVVSEISRCTRKENCATLPDCSSFTIENLNPDTVYKVHLIVEKFEEEYVHSVVFSEKPKIIMQTESKYVQESNSILITVTAPPLNDSAKCNIELLIGAENNSEEFVKATECNDTEGNSCVSPQPCTKIVINQIQPYKKYKIVVSIAASDASMEIFMTTTPKNIDPLEPVFSHNYDAQKLTITGKYSLEYASSKCEWSLRVKQDGTLEDFKSCNTATKEHCSELPLCSTIEIDGVDPKRDYQLEVKVDGSEKMFYYDIVKAPTTHPSFEIFYFYYGENLLVGTKTEPSTTETFKCEWVLELQNPDQSYTPLLKCVKDDLGVCGQLPPCNKLTINNVDKTKSYRLTVSYDGQQETSKSVDIIPGSEKGILELPYTASKTQVTINAKIFPFVVDAKCSWVLESQNDEGIYAPTKQCSSELLQDCAELPLCNNMVIDVSSTALEQRITVTVSGISLSKSFTFSDGSTTDPDTDKKSDSSVDDSDEIKISKTTVIIIIVVSVGILFMAVIALVVCMRHRSRGVDGLVLSDEY